MDKMATVRIGVEKMRDVLLWQTGSLLYRTGKIKCTGVESEVFTSLYKVVRITSNIDDATHSPFRVSSALRF